MSLLDNLRASRAQKRTVIDAAATEFLNELRDPAPQRAGANPYGPPARTPKWRDLTNPAEQELTHADELAYDDERSDND